MKNGVLWAEGGVDAPEENDVLRCDGEGEVEVSEIESSTAVGGAAGEGVAWVSVFALTSAVAAEASAVAVV